MSQTGEPIGAFVRTCRTQMVGSTEPTFYPAVQSLLNAVIAAQKHLGKLSVQVNPSKEEGGMPDLRIAHDDFLIGVVEVKHPEKVGNDDMLTLCMDEQVVRYREAFGTVLVTNLTKWILLTPDIGMTRKDIKAAPKCVLVASLEDDPEDKAMQDLLRLLERFLENDPQPESRPKPFARRLARRAQILYEATHKQLHAELNRGSGDLLELLENASTTLRSDFTFKAGIIPPDEVLDAFADTIAQAVTYGLFYAKLEDRSSEKFTLGEAVASFPQSVPVLYEIVSLAVKPVYRGSEFSDAVNAIIDALRMCDAEKLQTAMEKEGKRDPVIYLYEDFLREYNPEVQDVRGVYYTPKEIVRFMVRGVEEILKKHFAIGSLSDERVAVLDPAAGTGTFLLEFLSEALTNVQKARRRAWTHAAVAGGEDGAKRRIFGFELLPAPYVILHQRINRLLHKLDAPLEPRERAGVYLTNTLENPEWEVESEANKKSKGYIPHEQVDALLREKLRGTLPSFRRETEDATIVKEHAPILVILGNPPYQGHSKNESLFIDGLIRPYFFNDGDESKGKLNDIKLSKWIRNDYVKFFRFAQWKIDEAPDTPPLNHGIVALITDHSWLTSRVYAGMRAHLLRHFSHAYIADLHGNSRKREFPPDGKANEPVFQIQQGVAITFLVKEPGHVYKPDGPLATLQTVDVWGTEQEKFNWLNTKLLADIHSPQTLTAPHYKIGSGAGESEGMPLDEIMMPMKGRTGVMSGRDHFATAFTKAEMEQHLKDLVSLSDPEFRQKFAKKNKPLEDVRDWTLAEARAAYIADAKTVPVVPILYRPFDRRWHGYGRVTSSVPGAINRAFIEQENNVAILLSPDSHAVGGQKWSNCWATKCVTNLDIFRRSGAYIFPKRLADGTPGIRSEILDALSAAYKQKINIDQSFSYLYGLFWTPGYREEFQAELLDGYPTVVFPKNEEVFRKVSELGQRLLDLHTLTASSLSDGTDIVDFPIAPKGDVIIEKPHYEEAAKKYWLNGSVYAESIEPDVMNFSIGGYSSVLHDYVCAREGRVWMEEDYSAWVKAVDAIRKTFAVQKELDSLYPKLRRTILEIDITSKESGPWKMQSPDNPQEKLW